MEIYPLRLKFAEGKFFTQRERADENIIDQTSNESPRLITIYPHHKLNYRNMYCHLKFALAIHIIQRKYNTTVNHMAFLLTYYFYNSYINAGNLRSVLWETHL